MQAQDGGLCAEDVLCGVAQPRDLVRIERKAPVLWRHPRARVEQLVQHHLRSARRLVRLREPGVPSTLRPNSRQPLAAGDDRWVHGWEAPSCTTDASA